MCSVLFSRSDVTTARSKTYRTQRHGRNVRKFGRRLTIERLDARRVFAVVLADFNGDGFDDMVTGIPGEDVNGVDAGAISVIYGTSAGLSTAGNQLWHQDSSGVDEVAAAGDRFGATLAAGDFNNDGFDDLAIGVPDEDVNEQADAGAVQILYGSSAGLNANADLLIHQDVSGMAEVVEANDRFGSVLSTGDYNGDGYRDLAIGVPNENIAHQQDAGVVQVLYGSSAGLKITGNQIFQEGSGDLGGTAERYDYFGGALATGDFNHDGRDDLAIGLPGEDSSSSDIGMVCVLYGTSSGLSAVNYSAYTQDTTNVPDVAEAWDNFGSALAAGDFDGDGFADLAIGTPNENRSSLTDSGAVHVMYGQSAFGFNSARHQLWDQDATDIEGTAQSLDYFGAALAAADFNGDGRDDLAIGIPGDKVGLQLAAGAVSLIYGSSTGLTSANDRLYHQDSSDVDGTAEASDYFGSVLAAGRTNNDSFADLAVGIPYDNVNSMNNGGSVQVFRGQSMGFRLDTDVVWNQDVFGIADSSEVNDFFGGDKPLSMAGGVPQLQSNVNSTKYLFLDFDGGTSSGVYTPPFQLDDVAQTNRTERSMIEDIWAVVAEDFAPFGINVTTFLPAGVLANQIFRVLIGGDGTERQEKPTSGWGPGDFTDDDGSNNDVYVYSKRIQSWYGVTDNLAYRIGTTASHEAGHGFGLSHKSTYHAFGALIDEYSDGGSDWTPIMGGNLSTDRTIWTQENMALTTDTNVKGSNDFAVLESELGLRADDHFNSTSAATYLGSIGSAGMLADSGSINKITDVDVFRFYVTTSGTFSMNVIVADVGANLNSTLTLRDSSGKVLASSSPDDDLNATIYRSLGVGNYYVTVGSKGQFSGDVGRYALRVQRGTVIIPPAGFLSDSSGSSTSGGSNAGDVAAHSHSDAEAHGQRHQLATRNDARSFRGPGNSMALADGHARAVDVVFSNWNRGPAATRSNTTINAERPLRKRLDCLDAVELEAEDVYDLLARS